MAISVPGLSLSILRQETTVRAGRPLLISGRFTAFGVGLPAFIRVFLEGPSYDPQLRGFDAFASPFSGDYSINVIPEKDGRYNVYSQAFPPPFLPAGPLLPEPILLPPPIAESTHPPIAVGIPFDGGVEALMPDGARQFLPAPPMAPIEVSPVFAITLPGVPAAPRPVALLPPYPAAVPAPPVGPPVPTIARAAIDEISFQPPSITPGQDATGVMAWRNTGDTVQNFTAAVSLIGPVGTQYGPLQVTERVSAGPQLPKLLSLRLDTEGLAPGTYGVLGELYDPDTGERVTSRTLPGRLVVATVPAPPPPAPPEIPLPPEVPAAPTIEMLGQPSFNLPRQVTVGQAWTGSVGMPTYGEAPYFLDARLILEDPRGFETPVSTVARVTQPGETLLFPVNFNTSGYEPGDYGIILRVMDDRGFLLKDFALGFLTMVAAVLPPLPPELPPPPVPEAPRLPTADMLGIPDVVAPPEIELGQLWRGDVSIPTSYPTRLPEIPGLPSYPLNLALEVESPTGVRYLVRRAQPSFTPGDTITVPFEFNTAALRETGGYNILAEIKDLPGNRLFSNAIGYLQVLAAAVPAPPLPPAPPELPPAPPEIPEVPVPSKFSAVAVEMVGPEQVEVGQPITIPFTYTHVGAPEMVTLRAAIGDERPAYLGGFDEVWWADKTVSVPAHAFPTPISESITIQITPKFQAAGIYSVYAKVDGGIPRAESPHLINIIQVVEPPPVAPPAPSQFTSIRVNIRHQEVEPGDTLTVPVTYIHVGDAQDARLYAAIGNQGAIAFNEILVGQTPISVPRDESPTARSGEIPIRITEALSPETYDVYAKVAGIFPETISEPRLNIVIVPAPPEAPPRVVRISEFWDVKVAYPAELLRIGGICTLDVSFTHQGVGEQEFLYGAIGVDGVFGFDEKLVAQKPFRVLDDAEPTVYTERLLIAITSQIKGGNYDVYAKIGLGIRPRAISPIVHDVIRIL